MLIRNEVERPPRVSRSPLGRGTNVVMTREETKHRKADIRRQQTRVRQLLNEWDPLAGSAADEYDCLVDGVVSALHRGAGTSDLADLICSEFDSHFGVPVAREEAISVSSRILLWWSSSQARSPRA
jgi:hypothetical protein